MLTEHLPNCLCGEHDYAPGGGNFGGERSSQWFSCNACKRPVLILSQAGSFLLTLTDPGDEFPLDGFDWVNRKMDIFLRANAVRQQKAMEVWEKEFVWDVICDQMNVPHGTVVEGLWDKDKRTTNHWLKRPDGTKVEGDSPEEMVKFFQDGWEALRYAKKDECPRATDVIPPQIPKYLTVRYGRWVGPDETCDWQEPLSWDDSKTVPVPVDPRRLAHDEFFGKVFDDLRAAGFAIKDKTEIPNEYYGDVNKTEPWYTFTVGTRKFKVGPRKRVVNISVSSKTPFDATAITAMAKRDAVTFDTDRTDGSTRVNYVNIHAWFGKNTLMEYLLTLMPGVWEPMVLPGTHIQVLEFRDGTDRVEIVTDRPHPYHEDEPTLYLTLSFLIPRENTAAYLETHFGVTKYKRIKRRGKSHQGD